MHFFVFEFPYQLFSRVENSRLFILYIVLDLATGCTDLNYYFNKNYNNVSFQTFAFRCKITLVIDFLSNDCRCHDGFYEPRENTCYYVNT